MENLYEMEFYFTHVRICHDLRETCSFPVYFCLHSSSHKSWSINEYRTVKLKVPFQISDSSKNSIYFISLLLGIRFFSVMVAHPTKELVFTFAARTSYFN